MRLNTFGNLVKVRTLFQSFGFCIISFYRTILLQMRFTWRSCYKFLDNEPAKNAVLFRADNACMEKIFRSIGTISW